MTWGKENGSRGREPFEEQWPDLARGLDHALRVRRVPASRREDIIQETGLRLFVRWGKLDPERPIWPFALTIALNLMKDEQRMQARRSAAAPLDDVIERGVEEEALARLELTNVQDALQKLTPAQRSVLLADLGELPYDDRAPAALKMLRMRARRTLRNVIDRASALVPLAALKTRHAFNSVSVNVQRNAGAEVANLVVVSTLGIAGAASLIGAALGGTADVQRAPHAAPREAVSLAATDGSGAAPTVRAVGGHDRAGLIVRPPPLRGTTMARDGRRTHRTGQPVATVGAGGTGIDEEPSLHSDRFRVSVFAKTAVSEQETVLDYEVEQANPMCGSPEGSDDASDPCIRAEAPRARGRGRVAGRSLPKIGR